MKKYIVLLGTVLSLALCGCDNSKELTPRIEDLTDDAIVVPTSRLTYEERDIIKNMQKEYEEAVAARAAGKY